MAHPSSLSDLRPYCGDLSQLAAAHLSTLTDGPAAGVRTVDVKVMRGLSATVHVDRALDLGPTWAAGVPLGWISPAGVVHPSYATDQTWLRSFGAGLLTTAGLVNVGAPSGYDEIGYGLHGRISNTPARNVRIDLRHTSDGSRLVVQGEVQEASVYGPDTRLLRRLEFHVGEPVVDIHDEISNLAWKPVPLQVLCHFNIGYPVVSPRSELLLDSQKRTSLTGAPASSDQEWSLFTEPLAGDPGQVFEHALEGSEHLGAAIINRHEPTGPVGIFIASMARKRRPGSASSPLWHWRLPKSRMWPQTYRRITGEHP